jgi:release factor glutamine methyltransferase
MASDDRQTLRPYVSSLSAAEVDRLRRWQDRVYADSRARAAVEQTFDYLGVSIVVPPEVQPITPTSHLLGEAVLTEVHSDERVLDMGTGSGVNAVLAATKGAHVVAVDINPQALAVARANAERNGVSERIKIRHSDVFSDVDETFDLIVFDPPFRWFRPRDMIEAATTDDRYRAMRTFFRYAGQHLAPGGRMLIFFGTSGDMGYLQRLMTEEGFTWTVVAQLAGEKDGVAVEYSTFRVT